MSIKLSMAPIAWTNDDLPQLGGETPVSTYLEEIKQAGFYATELGGKFPKDKDELKNLLDKHGVKLSSGWFSGSLLPGTVEEEIARLDVEIDKRLHVGSDIIVYAECSNTIQGDIDKPLTEKAVLSEAEMKDYAEKYSALSRHARGRGVTLVYHYHMGTIIETEAEIDLFLKYCDSEAKIAFDTGHCYFAEGNPLAYLEKVFDRVGLVHFKDVRRDIMDKVKADNDSFLNAVLAGVYTMPGDGSIDFDPIVALLKERGYEGWLVIEAEQDPAKANPLEYAKNTKAYLDDLFGKYDIEVVKP